MAEGKQNPTPSSEQQIQPASPAVRDKRILPEGVVPKQAQAYVVAGLALLILMAVLFPKNHARTAPKESAPPPASVSNDMNQQRIHELEQNLSADQQQAQAQRSDAAAAPGGAASASGAAQTGNVNPAGLGGSTRRCLCPPLPCGSPHKT